MSVERYREFLHESGSYPEDVGGVPGFIRFLEAALNPFHDKHEEMLTWYYTSGAAADRPNLAACFDYPRRGDVLVVLDLDRLGRRAGELIGLIDDLELPPSRCVSAHPYRRPSRLALSCPSVPAAPRFRL